MKKQSRRKFSSEFKAKVVIEALRERSTTEELARKYEIHPNQIHTWKKEFLNNASVVFDGNGSSSSSQEDRETLVEKLYAQIGQQKVEIDWLKKKLL